MFPLPKKVVVLWFYTLVWHYFEHNSEAKESSITQNNSDKSLVDIFEHNILVTLFEH